VSERTARATAKSANKKTSSVRLPARERLLAAADELFYEHGINVVGIDKVIEKAGVAKATLYECFEGKEDLIRSYVQARDERRRARILDRIKPLKHPKDKALAVFDILSELASRPDFRGCAFNRAGAESTPEGKVRSACEEAREWMRQLFLGITREARAKDPENLARQLTVLYDGASVSAQFGGGPTAVVSARGSASLLLDAAAKSGRPRAARWEEK
jgi:AcrR family transcriptional regulator